MVFSSTVFLFAFLPGVILFYFVLPWKAAKNVLLLVASLVFYAWGEPAYVALMVLSVAVNWFFGLFVAPKAQPGGRHFSITKRRLCLVACLVVDLGILGFFKYEGFFAQNINALTGMQLVPDLQLPLPIGISFYTLQAVSYIVDAYRGVVKPQKNPIYLGMYIAMFPQLVAGPIVRYADIQDQIDNRCVTFDGFSQGVRLFIVGLAKKVLLANIVAILANSILSQSGADVGLVGAWAGLLAFAFQIYFDFAGYSDMAIGMGKMFGFQYLRNFNYPYISTSATSFWRRWHISLSTVFRDYVYIPLGGNRVTFARWVLNIGIVWGLTGFWHGASWNYVIWGLYFGFLLVMEKRVWGNFLGRRNAVVRHFYGVVVFLFGWLLFWVEDVGRLPDYIATLFGAYGLTGSSTFWEIEAWTYLPFFVVCSIAALPIVPFLRYRLQLWAAGKKYTKGEFIRDDIVNEKVHSTEYLCRLDIPFDAVNHRAVLLRLVGWASDAALLCMLVLSLAAIVSGSYNPFIYFRF